MIEALLQGKLSNEQENMEDLLTSMVFGSFRRMSVEQGLLPFLRESEEITGICPLTQNNKLYSAEYGRYEFWPSWQGFDNVDSCEPDVVIKLDAGKTVGLAKIHLISRPLVDITNSEKLQDYIIDPLLQQTGSN